MAGKLILSQKRGTKLSPSHSSDHKSNTCTNFEIQAKVRSEISSN